MKYKILAIGFSLLSVFHTFAKDSDFEETVTVYGVIKPGKMTNLIAVNNGMVEKIPFRVGEKIRFGQVALSAIERETTRGYRSTINGRVAKLHVSVGAAVTPGMPLVTIIDPNVKLVEVALSPLEGQKIHPGSLVYRGKSAEEFGKVESVSPLVDPDTGGVISYIKPSAKLDALIGDVLPLRIATRQIEDCKVVSLSEVDNHLDQHRVIATTGNKVCLKAKNTEKK